MLTNADQPATLRFTPHMPLSNPLSAIGDGWDRTCVTIDVKGFTMATHDRNIFVASGSIEHAAPETLYYVYFDNSEVASRDSIVPAYQISKAPITAGFGGRFFVGSIRTPAKFGPPTIGNDDGGAEKRPVMNLEEEKSIQETSGIRDTRPASSKRHFKKPANKRESFVMPILAKKGWSINDWATQSDLDFHTASGYLKCRTNPYPSTRKKFADSLGVGVEELPQ